MNTPDSPASPPEAPEYTLVAAPAEGIPDVVRTPEALTAITAALAAGNGPVALDTERAHGFRYSGRAYLIQLRREGAGTVLLDPIAFSGADGRAHLGSLAEALSDAEWILHAATQDLPCLAEVELLPHTLFDTELGGRLLGLPRVSLGSLTERALGKSLAKEHSASDWSRRPLPESWLNYAALDVELLVPLRDWVAQELQAAGKRDWAEEEFAYLVDHAADPPHRRKDPWRRTAGTHEVRTPRGLAVVRELWQERDQIAARLDKAPGRILADRAITALAAQAESRGFALSRDAVRSVNGFTGRQASRFENNWIAATERALGLPTADLPPKRAAAEGPPHPKNWEHRFPEAAQRWAAMRPATVELAETWSLPVENLISPDALRRLAFEPPTPASTASVDAFLADLGVRQWQRDLVVPVVAPLV